MSWWDFEENEIVRQWDNLMEGCNAQNKSEIKKTFLVYSIKKEEWGYNLMVTIPAGCTFEQFEKLKPAIQVHYPCNVEIARKPLSKLTNVKLIMKDFSKQEFKPIKLAPNKLLLGYDLMDKPIIVDMNKFPHVLIAGMTGMGKSRLLLIILTNLVYSFENNLSIYLCALSKNDHKIFKNDRAVKGYYKDISEIRTLYQSLNKLREQREDIMDRAGCINIEEYNRKTKTKMEYIYISADEFSLYMPDDSDTKKVEEDKKVALALLKIIIKEGRSAGIFVILGIQVATYQEMPTVVRRSCNVKITFKQSDELSSKVIINIPEAIDLERREFIIYTDEYKRCKTPNIELETIKEYISPIKEEKTVSEPVASLFIHSVTEVKRPIKYNKFCERIEKKVEDLPNYGKLPRGKQKGVLGDVNKNG